MSTANKFYVRIKKTERDIFELYDGNAVETENPGAISIQTASGSLSRF